MSWHIQLNGSKEAVQSVIKERFEIAAKAQHNSEFASSMIMNNAKLALDFIDNLNNKGISLESSGHCDSNGYGNMKLEIKQIDFVEKIK